MGRVALVTGGTRGIGAAISKGLKDAGYKVAANYGGNDEAANQFKTETGIPVFKFDVSDAASCETGIRAVEAEITALDSAAPAARELIAQLYDCLDRYDLSAMMRRLEDV